MTATLTQVRQALATRLGTITGLNPYAFSPGAINEPAAVVKPAPGNFMDYKVTFDAHDLQLVIGLFVGGGDDESSTQALDAYIAASGPQSIYAVVAADPTLGGVVDSCEVMSAQDHGRYGYGDLNYWGCQFPVEVYL